jgi:hypothetical protein
VRDDPREPADTDGFQRQAVAPGRLASQPRRRSARRIWSQRSTTASDTAAKLSSPAPGRAVTKYVPDGKPLADSARKIMRIRLRRRFLATASPTERLMANATLGGIGGNSGRDSAANRTPIGEVVRKRRPSVARRSKTARSRTDQIRPTAWRGPCRGAPSGRPDRRGLTSADESRASWTVSGCSVERCASPMPPRPHQCGGRLAAAKNVPTTAAFERRSAGKPPAQRVYATCGSARSATRAAIDGRRARKWPVSIGIMRGNRPLPTIHRGLLRCFFRRCACRRRQRIYRTRVRPPHTVDRGVDDGQLA